MRDAPLNFRQLFVLCAYVCVCVCDALTHVYSYISHTHTDTYIHYIYVKVCCRPYRGSGTHARRYTHARTIKIIGDVYYKLYSAQMKIMSRRVILYVYAARGGDDYDATCSPNGEINIVAETNEYQSVVYRLLPVHRTRYVCYTYIYVRAPNVFE